MDPSAVLYGRTSAEEQARAGTIQNQVIYGERWSDAQGVPLDTMYLDDGVSGMLPLHERPEGKRLLADAAAGRIKTVVVYSLDRLGRDDFYIALAVHTLRGYGVTVRSMTENFDETPAGRLMQTVFAGIAAFNRSQMLERMAQGKYRVAGKGKYFGGIPPLGYRLVPHTSGHGHMLDLDPVEAPIVAEMYRLVADEGWKMAQVAEWLNIQSIPLTFDRLGRTWTGKRKRRHPGWSEGTVYGILRHKLYRGIYEYGKGNTDREPVTYACPRIVDDLTWYRVQEQMRQNNRFASRNSNADYLLRGLIHCQVCGYSYTGSTTHTRGRAYRYYNCTSHARPNCTCELGLIKSIYAAPLEEGVWQLVVAFLRDPAPHLERLARERKADSELVRLEVQAVTLERQLEEQRTARDEMLTLWRRRRGRADDEALNHQLDQIDAEESRLLKAVDAVAQRLVIEQGREVMDLSALAPSLKEMLDVESLPFAARRVVVEALIIDVVIQVDRSAVVDSRFGVMAV